MVLCRKTDSKEADPTLKSTFARVDNEVSHELQAQGIKPGRWYGARSDRLKKQKLKSIGIEWRTFEELNPETTENEWRRY
jgi:hypothetical protein